MSNDDSVIRDVEHKIQRERALIDGFNATRQASDNPAVQSGADNEIRSARRNIEYLESKLRELQMRKMSQGMGNLSVGQNGRPMPPTHGSQQPPQQQRGGYRTAPQPPLYPGQPIASERDNGDYGDPGPGGYSDLNTAHRMPPRGPFQPSGPGSPTARGRPNYSKLDLIKYDTPHLGPRIQLMLSQLEFKLSVEKQYKDGIEKIIGSYRMDGDKKIRQEAQGRHVESMQKIHLLRMALKRYEDLHVDMDSAADVADDDSLNAPSMRKPLSGQLSIRVHAVSDVNHSSPGRWSRGPETFVIMKVEDDIKGRTKATRTDKWADELHEIDIDKGNEIELTVYDKSGGDHPLPIGMLWIRISDIAEEMRRKRIETEFNNSGWVSADRTVEDGGPVRQDLQFQPPPGSSGQVPNNFAGGSFGNHPGQPQTGPVVIESWFSLEPVGRIHLSMSFVKQTREPKPFDAGLYRKGAIRQRKEDVHELHGHKFVAQQFYNIMRCALCGELLKYATGMQCSDCKYLCHEKCYPLVVTKCISKSNAESDPDEAKLNHRIPHRFETYGNMGANWCCHCGYILPLGRKTCKKCKECKLACHAQCTHLVPDFCGMSMKDANRFLGEIKQAQAKASSNKTHSLRPPGREPKPRPAPSSPPSFQSEPGSSQLQKDRFSYGHDDPNQTQTQVQGKASETSLGGARSAFNNTSSTFQPSQQLQQQQQQQVQQKRPTPGRSESSQSAAAAAAAAAASALSGKNRSPTEPKAPAYPRTASSNSGGERSYSTPQHVQYNPGDYAQLEQRYGPPPTQVNHPQAPTEQYTGQKYDAAVASQSEQSQTRLPSAAQQQPVGRAPVGQYAEQRNAPSLAGQRGTGRRVGLDHFNFLAVLGKGNFGKVMLAETKQGKQLFAIKVLKKEFIIENDEVESTKSERDVFIIANRAKHPFLLNLSACFQTETRVYFVMEYISGGDLMLHIQRGQFGTKRAQFYAAEVCLALKYFHENGVVYRDLKLDNILLTLDGHIKIADYGLCKKDMYYGSTTTTFCGTPEFMAPEILLDKRYGRAVDWWAFGVLIYQMLLQQSPFRGEDEDEIYDAILADEPLYPIHMPRDSVSILQKLLTREPELRLGSGPTDAQEIMSHAFFRNINWEDVYNKKVPAPFMPSIRNPTDTSNFDSEFTSVTPVLTPVNSVLSSAQQEEFRGFSYSADFV